MLPTKRRLDYKVRFVGDSLAQRLGPWERDIVGTLKPTLW